jgi:integrase
MAHLEGGILCARCGKLCYHSIFVSKIVPQEKEDSTMKLKKLTDREIAGLDPKDKRYMQSTDDGLGLYIEVMTSGAKYWRMRYHKGKKEEKVTLGKYPILRLADARQMCTDIRRKLALGEGTRAREILNPPAAATFGELAEQWYAKNVSEWSKSHATDVRHKLDVYLLPQLRDKPVASITVHDLISTFKPMTLRNILPSLNKARIIAGQVLQFALSIGEVTHNVALDLKGLLPSSRTKRHFASLTVPADVARLMLSIKGYPGTLIVRAALLFSAYTFQRPGEIRRAEWTEFDFKENLWRIPAEKMKAGKQHLVPLSSQVVALLEDLKPHTGRGQYVFPAIGKSKKGTVPMSENTITSALHSMGFGREEMCAHGFRSMASSNLNEVEWDSDLIERQLAHSEGNAAKASYDFSAKLPRRREMMQWWADWLDKRTEQ